MPRGPLPNPQRRRTNAPTLPGTALPADGRPGPAPECPVILDSAGARWWEWAWHTPQAAAWDAGSLYAAARRAGLEDDLAALDSVRSLDAIDDLLANAGDSQEFRRMIKRLASVATGRIGVVREMRELDKAMGLNPKAMADLRWSIDKTEPDEKPANHPASVRRLHAVDPTLAASGT